MSIDFYYIPMKKMPQLKLPQLNSDKNIEIPQWMNIGFSTWQQDMKKFYGG